MAWIVLIGSGTLEAVWARALARVKGLSTPIPLVIFLLALGLSLVGLSHAMVSIPAGTAYAVWVGVGASLTVIIGMATKEESFSWTRVALVAILIGCVIGLKVSE